MECYRKRELFQIEREKKNIYHNLLYMAMMMMKKNDEDYRFFEPDLIAMAAANYVLFLCAYFFPLVFFCVPEITLLLLYFKKGRD